MKISEKVENYGFSVDFLVKAMVLPILFVNEYIISTNEGHVVLL